MIWVTIILSMIAAYTVFWAGVVSLIGFAGWKQIAERFPADHWPNDEGVALSWQSGRIGASQYNGVLKAAIMTDGFYLQPVRLFAFNHPPVYIPWGSIVGTSKGMLGGLKLQLDGGKSLLLRGKVAKYVTEALDAYDVNDELGPPDSLGELAANELPSGSSKVGRLRART